MSRFLIVYGSKYGQSQKIAKFIGDELSKLGHSAEIFDASDIPHSVTPESYDFVIVGGSVEMNAFSHALTSWVKNHSQSLSKKPSAFFSVSLAALENSQEVQYSLKAIMNRFFNKTDWHPKTWSTFAGALTYSKYNWLLKRIMRWISKKSGAVTNIAQDYEYTNWDEVRRFAQNLAPLETATVSAS